MIKRGSRNIGRGTHNNMALDWDLQNVTLSGTYTYVDFSKCIIGNTVFDGNFDTCIFPKENTDTCEWIGNFTRCIYR